MPCERRGLEAIRSLPLDYRALAEELMPGNAKSDTPSRIMRIEATLPIRLDIDAQMRQVHWVLCNWTEAVRRIMRFSTLPLRHRHNHETVAIMAACLADSYSVLLALVEQEQEDYETGDFIFQDGVDGVLELIAVHDRTRRLLGQARTWEQRKMPCPSTPMGNGCGRWTLGTWVGSGIVECSNCGWSCSQGDYETYVFTMVPGGRR